MSNSSSVSCSHVENYKKKYNFFLYSHMYVTFVTSLSEDARETKAKFQRCFECQTTRHKLNSCLHCVFIGCFTNGHIIKHSEDNGHFISMDIKFGNVYCHICHEYMYDIDFERLSKACKRVSGEMIGLKIYWEPTPEEIQLIKENGGFKKIHKNSFIGLRGLTNLGDTCYLNCIVQVFIHTLPLKEYFFVKHDCEMENCLVCEMFIIFQEFYSGNPLCYDMPRLVYLVWIHAKHFEGCHQQDAHEFYLSLLDILHKQCQGKDPDETNSCMCVIDQIFKGFYRSDIICQECDYTSATYQAFLDINLNIGGSTNAGTKDVEQGTVSLLDCISRYTQPENLHIQCEKCGKTTITKQLTFKVLPAVACFHLNRLEGSSNEKNTRHVIFPECFDMSPYMSSNRSIALNDPTKMDEDVINTSENKFCLFAVVIHKGNRDGGHYISYIKHHNKWYQCDDALITSASMQDILASEGYLLFYQKQVLEEENVSTMFRQKVPNKGPG